MKQRDVIPADSNWVGKNIRDLAGSPAARIGDGWTLITAGNVDTDKGNWNTMTASWGGLGVLWGKDVSFIFVRPQRYTFEFVNANPLYTVAFFDKPWKKALGIAGAKSGRDIDKAAETGLTPIVFKDGTIGFKEATEVISCRRFYDHDFDPAKFLDKTLRDTIYPDKDYHRMYIGEVTTLWVKG
ncbi:flavin reductase family protein [Treponema primitia]|uniref:flavin reductase n=1 Tax=Treponema primitia TaxID=88058 RepID=UPI00397E9783